MMLLHREQFGVRSHHFTFIVEVDGLCPLLLCSL